ncbi:20118_t:CDS:2, partial [Dentiscutata erythropus]
LFELPLDLLFPVSSSSHTFTAPPGLANINFSLPLNPILSGLPLNLMSPGPSQNPMSTIFPEPIDINSPVDFLSPLVNLSSNHQPSDLNDDGIITDTDSEESENSIITSELN